MGETPKAGAVQVTVSGFGAAASKAAEHFDKFTLSDVAALLTIMYTAWIFYCSVVDRLEKRRKRKRGEMI
jgi:hypothetical protein